MTDKEKEEAGNKLLRDVMFFHVTGCVACLLLGFFAGAMFASRPEKQDTANESNEEENKKEEEN